jgi:hypothetical protein
MLEAVIGITMRNSAAAAHLYLRAGLTRPGQASQRQEPGVLSQSRGRASLLH